MQTPIRKATFIIRFWIFGRMATRLMITPGAVRPNTSVAANRASFRSLTNLLLGYAMSWQ